MRQVKIFTGSSHPELSSLILDRLGSQAAPASLKRFANAETSVEIETSVRDCDVFIIQSGSSQVNDHIMELLILVNACKLASARRITAVLPYFPYNKQSKKKSRSGITAKLLANMLRVAGVHHVLTLDLHSSQIQGFFQVPVDNLVSEPSLAKYIKDRFSDELLKTCIISKNAGGAKRVTSLADRLNVDFALIHRETHHLEEDKGRDQIETRLTLVGEVHNKICFLLDDVIDDPHSFLDSAEHLKRCGAAQIYIIATHGILSGGALNEIQNCEAVDEIIVTNSYPIPEQKRAFCTKLSVIDVSGVLAEAIRRTHNGESISYLFHTAI